MHCGPNDIEPYDVMPFVTHNVISYGRTTGWSYSQLIGTIANRCMNVTKN